MNTINKIPLALIGVFLAGVTGAATGRVINALAGWQPSEYRGTSELVQALGAISAIIGAIVAAIWISQSLQKPEQ